MSDSKAVKPKSPAASLLDRSDTARPQAMKAEVEPPFDREASARGIAQCLRVLAEEAASIGLGLTEGALQEALRVCSREANRDVPAQSANTGANARPRGSLLH